MTETTRREFLKNTSLGAAGFALSAAPLSQSAGENSMTESAPAFLAAVQPKPLWFDPAKLNGLSEKLIRSHWENNYGGSVKTLNAVKQRLAVALADKETPPFLYGDLKREHLMRSGSVVMHELYFDNLGGDGKPDAETRKAFATSFGSFEAWETEFRKIAASLGGGSGWVVTAYSPQTRLIENYWLADHLHFPAGTVPLVVMDMYEHSYHLDYGAAAAKYIDAFFLNLHWDTVVQRLAAAKS
jgi:Fe-Mn family superoxide dismutase